jgi:hypothetical protein
MTAFSFFFDTELNPGSLRISGYVINCLTPEAVLETMFDCSTSLLAGEVLVEVSSGIGNSMTSIIVKGSITSQSGSSAGSGSEIESRINKILVSSRRMVISGF